MFSSVKRGSTIWRLMFRRTLSLISMIYARTQQTVLVRWPPLLYGSNDFVYCLLRAVCINIECDDRRYVCQQCVKSLVNNLVAIMLKCTVSTQVTTLYEFSKKKNVRPHRPLYILQDLRIGMYIVHTKIIRKLSSKVTCCIYIHGDESEHILVYIYSLLLAHVYT